MERWSAKGLGDLLSVFGVFRFLARQPAVEGFGPGGVGGGEIGDELRLFSGEVVEFGAVGGDVVEFPAAGLIESVPDELVVAAADGEVAGPFPADLWRGGAFFAGEDRGE